MSVKLLVSFDIERPYKKDGKFETKDEEERVKYLELLDNVNQILDERNVSRTFFVLGGYLYQTVEKLGIEKLINTLKPMDERVEIAQETYSHPSIAPLKTRPDIKTISPEEFREELLKTKDSIETHLGVTPTSLRMPYGFYRGLSDYPEYLRVVGEEGISHVRADARSEDDLFDTYLIGEGKKIRQPFAYSNGVIEVPLNAPQDTAFTGESKTKGTEKYPRTPGGVLNVYKNILTQALNFESSFNRPLVISFDTHLHAIPKYDLELSVLKGVLDFCDANKIQAIKYNEVKV